MFLISAKIENKEPLKKFFTDNYNIYNLYNSKEGFFKFVLTVNKNIQIFHFEYLIEHYLLFWQNMKIYLYILGILDIIKIIFC